MSAVNQMPSKIVFVGVIGLLCLLFFVEMVSAQKLDLQKVYAHRANEMFMKVWKKYRVAKHPGLFAEYYPNALNQDLTYFQGEHVKQKEVSFLWPFSGVYSAANVLVRNPKFKKAYINYLDTLATGIWQYRDTTRKPIGYQAYPSKLEKADRYYDDNGLVGIDYAEAYLNLKNKAYLNKAKEVFTFIISGWDEQLNGGVYWLEGHKDQKPACSNGMATLAALKLYECTKDAYYLQWGLKFYNWMHAHLQNPQGIYYNDMKMDGKPNEVYYTYNTGAMLEAAVLLYRFTNDVRFLQEAKYLAKASFKHFGKTDANGQTTFEVDLPWFLTVLFRGYETLYTVDQNPQYINVMASTLNQAFEAAKDSNGLLTAKWKTDELSKNQPKWLLDESCIAELYARLSLLKINYKK